MRPELELQLLILNSPELMTLQQQIDETTKDMLPYAKCLYLQELLLDNVALLNTKMTELRRLVNEAN